MIVTASVDFQLPHCMFGHDVGQHWGHDLHVLVLHGTSYLYNPQGQWFIGNHDYGGTGIKEEDKKEKEEEEEEEKEEENIW